MSEKRLQWETIKEQAPDVADFLLSMNQAFGKPDAVRVELFATGEVIEIGGHLRVDPIVSMGGKGHVCCECRYWRHEAGAARGLCVNDDRETRRWLVDWPTQAACDLFEIIGGSDGKC
jgi:hypothetical protein